MIDEQLTLFADRRQAIQDENDRRASRRTSAERDAVWSKVGIGIVSVIIALGFAIIFLAGDSGL